MMSPEVAKSKKRCARCLKAECARVSDYPGSGGSAVLLMWTSIAGGKREGSGPEGSCGGLVYVDNVELKHAK